jgi:MFS transporter, DHA3 family, macrolide efflux protein
VTADLDLKKSQFFVLTDANSQRVFWGQLISQSCDKLMSVGMIWVFATRFSPHWIPWFIALGALPHFLLATRSGEWINRWGTLSTVIWADVFRGVLFVFCAWLVGRAGSDAELLPLLLVSAFISNIAGAFFNPAILSLPVDMVEPGEKREKLTALIDSCFSLGNVLGPLVSALAYAWVGLAGLLLINGLSYFFSAFLAAGVKLLPQEKSKVEAVEGVLPCKSEREAPAEPAGKVAPAEPEAASACPVAKPALVVLKQQPVISGMLFTFLLMNLFLAPIMIFMPWYAKNIYGDGILGLARLEAFFGSGAVAGGLLLSFVKLPGAIWKRTSICLSLMAFAYLSFTFSQNLWHGCFSVMLLGFFLALANVITLTFFQSAPEAQDVPVVMGMVNLISIASLPVSMGVLGSFIELVNVPNFAAICAVVVIALAASIRLIPGIQRV